MNECRWDTCSWYNYENYTGTQLNVSWYLNIIGLLWTVNIIFYREFLRVFFSPHSVLGMFDPYSVQPYRQLTATDVNTADHQALALTAALESMVLLKNDGALPFDKSKITSVALIGPNAQASSVMQGNYYGNTPYLVTPEQGFKQIHKDDVRQGFRYRF